MQTLVLIDEEANSVIIQDNGKVYSDTYRNFIDNDGGSILQYGIKKIDYNKTLESCWIDGKPFEQFPNRYAEKCISNIDVYLKSKAKRDKEVQDKKTEEIFRGYEEAERQAEEERLANLTPEEYLSELKTKYSNYAQEMLDEKARERSYDDMNSLCSYATSKNPRFSREAQKGVDWRDAVWEECYRILDMYVNGQIELASKEVFLSLLPKMEWDD